MVKGRAGNNVVTNSSNDAKPTEFVRPTLIQIFKYPLPNQPIDWTIPISQHGYGFEQLMDAGKARLPFSELQCLSYIIHYI